MNIDPSGNFPCLSIGLVVLAVVVLIDIVGVAESKCAKDEYDDNKVDHDVNEETGFRNIGLFLLRFWANRQFYFI